MFDALAMAIYRTVHDWRPADPAQPRGAVGLAPLVGMRPGTLSNKADPAHDSELTLREAIPVMRTAGDFQILAALAADVGHGIIPLGEFSKTHDLELLDLYAKHHAEIGETAAAIREALAAPNGRISRKAVRQVRRELIEDAQTGLEFLSRLEALAEDDE
jgi:hypothetical protein